MHHAHLLIGTLPWALTQIPESDRAEGPDVLFFRYERMGIGDVRSLIYQAGLRPVARESRAFIIAADTILPEAQNALLKLLEEPNAHTVFYIVTAREDMLLPTLLSRLNRRASEAQSVDTHAFLAFKKAPYAERLQMITEKLGAEDVAWVTALIQGIAAHAHTTRQAKLIEEVLYVESCILAPGSSKKMLLEHLALTL
jgi:hypothetical protein